MFLEKWRPLSLSKPTVTSSCTWITLVASFLKCRKLCGQKLPEGPCFWLETFRSPLSSVSCIPGIWTCKNGKQSTWQSCCSIQRAGQGCYRVAVEVHLVQEARCSSVAASAPLENCLLPHGEWTFLFNWGLNLVSEDVQRPVLRKQLNLV